jgi:hypothetical protein
MFVRESSSTEVKGFVPSSATLALENLYSEHREKKKQRAWDTRERLDHYQ